MKHVASFVNELRQAGCKPDTGLRIPVYSSREETYESTDNVDDLGPYDLTSHHAYMQLYCRRLKQLNRGCTALALSNYPRNPLEMATMAKAAYAVRKSSSFHRFVKHNITATEKQLAVQSMAESLKERLGKMSRFWRAAQTLTSFGSILSSRNTTIQIACLSTSRLQVPELNNRTVTQLLHRGGKHFNACNTLQLQRKLAQWPAYRLHCEIQLVVFYEENPHIQLLSPYVGCDKLACYLCYCFLASHGRFQIKGSHQGLYSLWTVPCNVSFENADRAQLFQSALKTLANTLEQNLGSIRRAKVFQWKYRQYHESTANLSRISLQLPILPMVKDSTLTNPVAEELETLDRNSINGSELFSIIECADLDEQNDPASTAAVDQNPVVLSDVAVIVAYDDRSRDYEPNNNERVDQQTALEVNTTETRKLSSSRDRSNDAVSVADRNPFLSAITPDVEASQTQDIFAESKRRRKRASAKHPQLPKQPRKRRRRRHDSHRVSHSVPGSSNRRSSHASHKSRGKGRRKSSESTSKQKFVGLTLWDYLSWMVQSWFLRCIS
jgi:OTT_1508-like deaminase